MEGVILAREGIDSLDICSNISNCHKSSTEQQYLESCNAYLQALDTLGRPLLSQATFDQRSSYEQR